MSRRGPSRPVCHPAPGQPVEPPGVGRPSSRSRRGDRPGRQRARRCRNTKALSMTATGSVSSPPGPPPRPLDQAAATPAPTRACPVRPAGLPSPRATTDRRCRTPVQQPRPASSCRTPANPLPGQYRTTAAYPVIRPTCAIAADRVWSADAQRCLRAQKPSRLSSSA